MVGKKGQSKIVMYGAQEVSYCDGKMKKSSTTSRYRVSKEEVYFKFYSTGITDYLLSEAALEWVSKGTMLTLFSLLKRVQFNGEVFLTKEEKDDIAQELKLSLSLISKAIGILTDNKVIFRASRAKYVLNPEIFGIGSWEEVIKKREEFSASK
jgi:hypothetical protein